MSTAAQLRFVPLPAHGNQISSNRHLSSQIASFPILPPSSLRMESLQPNLLQNFKCAFSGGNGSDGAGRGGNGGGGGGSGGGKDSHDDSSSPSWVGPVGAFINGWRSRVAADSQFPFKVLMEELVGVTACVLGDMASRPNFGLNELDFVFSTLVVGSILNFVLMYLLAPTLSSSAAATLPSIFASCPTGHMFEPGPFGIADRFGTFVYKGLLFAAVGFSAGLVGTAISNGLIKVRKMMDPNFETPNKPPPTLLNAGTWALHMGISSNLRYQSLNGLEYVLDKFLPSVVFKTSVLVLRCLNNVLGGASFVVLARLTGSQSTDDGGDVVAVVADEVAELSANAKLLGVSEVDSYSEKKSN